MERDFILYLKYDLIKFFLSERKRWIKENRGVDRFIKKKYRYESFFLKFEILLSFSNHGEIEMFETEIKQPIYAHRAIIRYPDESIAPHNARSQ